MKRLLPFVLGIGLCLSSAPAHSRESMDMHAKNTDEIYRMGVGASDGAYTATATSIIGWGIGLFIVIGIVAALVHQSKAKTTTTS